MSAPIPERSLDPLLGGGLLLFLLMSLHFAGDLARGEGARLGIGTAGFFAFAVAFLFLLLASLGLRIVRPPTGAALLLVTSLMAVLFLVGGHVLGWADSVEAVIEDGGLAAAWALLLGVTVGLGTALLAAWDLWRQASRGERA